MLRRTMKWIGKQIGIGREIRCSVVWEDKREVSRRIGRKERKQKWQRKKERAAGPT